MTATERISALASPEVWQLARRPHVDIVRRRLLITDSVSLIAATLVVAAICWNRNPRVPMVWALIAIVVVWELALVWRSSRHADVLGAGIEEYRRLADATVATLLVACTISVLFGVQNVSRLVLLILPIGLFLLAIGRWINRVILSREAAAGTTLHRVLVIATTERAHELTEQLHRYSTAGYRVVSTLPEEVMAQSPSVVIDDATTKGADTIVVTSGGTQSNNWVRELGWQLEGRDISLMLSPVLAEIAGPRLSVHPAEGLALIRVDEPAFNGPTRAVKRLLDLVGGLLGLIILGIPMLIAAAAVKLDSKGPVFFTQTRMGRDGEPFRVLKFRTMVDGADSMRDQLREEAQTSGATFKLEDDPRVTRVGRFLRRYSIDELPQLFNVLGGSMSLVGPRPHPVDDVERYDVRAHRRFAVKPGMTGLWQVSGRSDLDWDEGLQIDLRYVENWSVSLDLALLAKTITVVARGTGAY